MRRLTATALLLATAACLREPDPFEYTEPALSLHGVLRADETGVRLSLFRSPTQGSVEEVDAQVTLSGAGTTLALARVAGAEPDVCYSSEFSREGAPVFPGCYAGTLPQPAAPGSHWTLTADVAGEQTATGSTVIPAPPAVLRPAAGTRVTFVRYGQEPGEFEVEWQTASAPRVEIRVSEGTAFHNGARVQGSTCFVAHRQVQAAVGQPSGSRRVVVDDVYCYSGPGGEIAWDSAAVPVTVTAFDSAYAEFALHGRSVTSGHRGASLQGAYGVFGSAASTRREVILVPRL
jgi:hypothetical protein